MFLQLEVMVKISSESLSLAFCVLSQKLSQSETEPKFLEEIHLLLVRPV